MPSNQAYSVFDIIGPVMVGPSSSHTAGAVRLGRIGLALLNRKPEQAIVEFHGSFALTGKGHGTDRAIVAGLLNLETNDDQIKDSLSLAEKAGLKVSFKQIDLGDQVHPNSVRLTLVGGDATVQMIGSSIGGGQVEITKIEGYPVSISGNFDTLLVVAEDKPGTVNAVTGWLLYQNINVAFLKVGREKRGGKAIMTIETDSVIPDHLVETVSRFEWVRWVRRIAKLSN